MTREEKENLLNDFLHEILVKKTVRIEQPLSSNTIAQAVIDYLDKEQKQKDIDLLVMNQNTERLKEGKHMIVIIVQMLMVKKYRTV